MKNILINATEKWIKENSADIAGILIDNSSEEKYSYQILIIETILNQVSKEVYELLIEKHDIEKVDVTFHQRQFSFDVTVHIDRDFYGSKYSFESASGQSVPEIVNDLDRLLSKSRAEKLAQDNLVTETKEA